MKTLKEKLDAKIGAMLEKSQDPRPIVRRLLFFDFTPIFETDEDRGFSILSEVSQHFRVPFSAVKVVGSCQLGYSYFSQRDFTPKISDLDLAIVSSTLFQEYAEFAYWATEQYTNQVKFTRRGGVSNADGFRKYLSMGYFRPDLMPTSDKKEAWFSFFNQLSNRHADKFSSVNAGIFLSEGFLEMKNTNLVTAYRKAVK